MKYRKIYSYLFLVLAVVLNGCSTMEQSVQLGGSLGALSGATATYAGYSAGGHPPGFETVAISAGIGAIVGITTAYFTHKSVEEDRKSCDAEQIEMHFGDLPPSPFIVPKPPTKKGMKQ